LTAAVARPITGYHAHIYYDEESRTAAAKLREDLDAAFEVRLGRWRDAPVGPHPRSMYQVAFAPDQFAELVPWLMLNRAGLVILVHPLTGDDRADHDAHALWLGEKLGLDLEALEPA
jgi:DOPA 4,5-dioxygenase